MIKPLRKIRKLLKLKKVTKTDIDIIYKRAVENDLFDRKWYEDFYSKRFSSEKEAFLDYIRKSSFAPVNPSENFDSVIYNRLNNDIYHADISPLEHYLSHGKNEGRISSAMSLQWQPTDNVKFSQKLTAEAKNLNVAFNLHIFYEDYIERFARQVEKFPLSVDVYISVAKKSFLEKTKSAFLKLKNVNKIEVRVGENRGRNFGPLLVEFASTVNDYDLLLHLHSKKSLYSGREQTQWSDYLTEYLLNEETVVKRVLNAFAQDPSLGVYYPTTFWMMPDWVNHMTMNKGPMAQWCSDLGIKLPSDFLAYPVGGMFWCRPKALSGILDRSYSYDDFPKEPLPNDGTKLHALERLIGVVAEHNGFSQLFYDPATARFTFDQGFIYQRYRSNIKNLEGLLQPYKCISFDVFDTLIRRYYTVPDYAKLKLGQELQAVNAVDNAEAFVELRNKTELDLRKAAKFKGDVSIVDVYKEMAKNLQVDEQLSSQWMNREFEIDLNMISSKDEMVQLFNDLGAAGKVLWVISDTYYTKDQVALMLKKAGVVAQHTLLVSSEEKLRKDNGTMWQFVKAELKKDKLSRYIHIGDNVVSDAQIPGDHGLANFHILHPMDKWKALGFPVKELSTSNEAEILKWGPLINNVGRNPFLGE
ncbi:rhamnan synthesis F family protein [Neptunomonas phycophila]|uniref:rhamnan synthesis F family protein n=1 Tax=Neptunomonas phycophila TaxID=1572645 RepID=UPI0026E42BB8|nr:rhamnan synthesis F family protein [Neptunomonas phycophila]MDO6782507.1 rhamnan synthesis F family protein [Neptunomonas phycophila]